MMQGGVGDCYFISSLSAIAEFPILIFQLFRTQEVNENGFYEKVLFIDGEWQIVFMDDYLPIKSGTEFLAFAGKNKTVDKKNELWVLLLEKAWAKLNGGYSNIRGGHPDEVFLTFTGSATEWVNHVALKNDEIWNIVKTADDSNKIMATCSNTEQVDNNGIVGNHAYSIIGTKSKIH